jgi:hypothetical protein
MSNFNIDPSLVLAFGLELDLGAIPTDSGIQELTMPKRPASFTDVALGGSDTAGGVNLEDGEKHMSYAARLSPASAVGEGYPFLVPADEVTDALSNLSPQQQAVLDRRFGLSSGQPEPDALIAADLAIRIEDIDSIEASSIRALFHPKKKAG